MFYSKDHQMYDKSYKTFYKNEFAKKSKINFNPLSTNPQNGQTHSNNFSALTEELFECVLPFCRVGA